MTLQLRLMTSSMSMFLSSNTENWSKTYTSVDAAADFAAVLEDDDILDKASSRLQQTTQLWLKYTISHKNSHHSSLSTCVQTSTYRISVYFSPCFSVSTLYQFKLTNHFIHYIKSFKSVSIQLQSSIPLSTIMNRTHFLQTVENRSNEHTWQGSVPSDRAG